ncbi:MAG: hypothetical protein JW864_13155 [Spirochaetes bacterium]|nr:hypothetical protein [Spirochaetota bacterium]
MKFYRIILTITIFLGSYFSQSLFAADNEEKEFKVYLVMDKLAFEYNENVLLHINIKNTAKSIGNFKIYDTVYTSFRPVVYDNLGRELETIIDYRLKNKSISEAIKGAGSRVIRLSNNETFSYSIDLKNIYRIDEGKDYRVKVFFSPDAADTFSIISENHLSFKILEQSDIQSSGIARIKRFISPERTLSPSEVISLFLKAEKEENWDNYFKFINIEKYINAYPDYVRVYKQAVEENNVELREKIILKFVNFLKEKRTDYIVSYRVLDDFININNNFYVEALVKRFGPDNPYVYKYKYSLEKFRNIWVVTDIEATVVKGRNI